MANEPGPIRGVHLTKLTGLTEHFGPSRRAFCWRRLRFEIGHYEYFTVPTLGLGWKRWIWEASGESLDSVWRRGAPIP